MTGDAVPTIRQITPRELKARMDAGDAPLLVDVREIAEREICHIGGELIPKDTVINNLAKIPRDGDVVIYCRSGGRSQWVAQELASKHGYSNLFNLVGGMLRWSDEVDPSVPKY